MAALAFGFGCGVAAWKPSAKPQRWRRQRQHQHQYQWRTLSRRVGVTAALDGVQLRKQFPLLDQDIHGERLRYLDSAATSQKPRRVLEAVNQFYRSANAADHRDTCASDLASRSADRVDAARAKVAQFVGSASPDQIVFTRNATEAINLVAFSWAMKYLNKGDEIILSVMEHHSNLVPWQMVAERTGAKLKFMKLDANQALDLMSLPGLLSPRTRLIACQHVSNVLGTVNPIQDIIDLGHAVGAKVLIDACQSVPHMPVDVESLGCDWLVASGHKMCGPTGIGFLWGRKESLAQMPPYIAGGLNAVEFTEDGSVEYAPLPGRLEGGMVGTAEIVGLGEACDFLTELGMDAVFEQEEKLGKTLYDRLTSFEEVTVYGPSKERAALCAFNVDGMHPTDLATMMDLEGVAIRTGHHCAQPLHRELGVESSARASLYIYNSEDEIEAFIGALKSAVELLGGKLTEKARDGAVV